MKPIKFLLQFAGVLFCSALFAHAAEMPMLFPLLVTGALVISFVPFQGNIFLTTTCGKITASILQDCLNPLQGGVNDRLILINYDEIDVITRDITNPQIITNITLKIIPPAVVAQKAFQIEGKNNSVAPTHAFVKQRFAEVFDHIVNFKAFDLTPAAKLQLENATQGRFVAIVENNFRGATGNAAFEIYGLDAGLIVTVLERDPNSTDTQGAYDVTMGSSEFAKEPHLPSTFFDTSYTATRTKVNALL